MNARLLPLLAALHLLAAVAALGWRYFADAQPDLEDVATATALPLPPVPPRIAHGRDYEQCLGMLDNDPAAAAGFALGWEAVGGGDGATHCLALSRIALGHAAEGAAMLEKLATTSAAAAAARATIYAQASQAWLIEDESVKAYGAITMALALLPDDADMLIDRAMNASALDRDDDAIADLDHALRLDPGRADALTLRATAHRQSDRLDAAAADIARALNLDPDYPEALLERGIIRQRRGDPAGAREDWERVIDLAPDTGAADLAEQNLALLEAGPAPK